MAKDAVKTIRMSQADLDFIETQPGDTFAQKFDNLIALMRDEVPKKQTQLDLLSQLYENRRRNLYDFDRDINKLEELIHECQQLHVTVRALYRHAASRLDGPPLPPVPSPPSQGRP